MSHINKQNFIEIELDHVDKELATLNQKLEELKGVIERLKLVRECFQVAYDQLKDSNQLQFEFVDPASEEPKELQG